MSSSNSSRKYGASSVSSRNKLMNLHKELSPESLYTFDVDQRNGHEEYPDATTLQFESFLSRINSKNINVNIGEETDNVKDTIDEEDFHDSDYNISGEDDDFQEVIVVNKNVKGRGRPKITPGSINVPSSSAIVVPPQVVDTESDYVDSDEMLEEVESEKEEDKLQEKVTYVEYNEEKHKDKPILELGMTFGNFTEFKQACMEWGIKNRRELKFYPNDTERVVCICKRKDCPFRIYASKLSQDDSTVQIKSINLTHKGGMVFDNPHMTPKYISRRYFENFKVDPNWSINGIIATVRKDLNYTISYKKAWRAKDQALKWVVGDESLQYGKLLSYRAELLNSNPGSTVVIWRNEEKFQGFYVCFGALKEAFKSGCRPFISLDGCWLKGNFGGNLLSAVAIDPNDCIFPVAYAVIAQNESKETWSWFLEILSEDLEIRNSHHIAFMSDRQKSLIGAVKDLFPFAEHKSCVRHMYQNFRGKHKGKALKDLVWSAAIASNEITFKKCMEKIEQEDREARNWFNHPERPFQSWTRALFKTNIRCDMLLNNLCESFNKYILDARDKPIITMLEMIKNKLMKRLHSKRIWIEKYQDKICPKIVKKLNKISNEAVMFKPDYSGGPKVLVNGPGDHMWWI
ncbi:uncharacterized protein LOC125825838 [Solanum verrucosum]|uniref:uncharacterized protein LOC125825838 n=1 Tax=Solanum verrucosum TaxID=315347 RepID=UPI0020D15D36|nr:uncharacterized protein LOC125825838 [Solanum verrucosum]